NHRRAGLEKKPNDKDLEFDNRPTLEIFLAFRALPLYKNSVGLRGEYFPREKNDEHKEANQDGQEVATKSKLKQGNNLIP
ncbi:unnamed protein product, partial [Brassica oleracea var. botrytis]